MPSALFNVEDDDRPVFLSGNGSYFCTYTGLINFAGTKGDRRKIPAHEHWHEAMHWNAHMATGSGAFLDALRGARQTAIITYLTTRVAQDHRIHAIAPKGVAPTAFPKIKYDNSVAALLSGSASLHPFHTNLTWSKLAERYFMKMSSVAPLINSQIKELSPINVFCRAFSDIEDFFDFEYYRKHTPVDDKSFLSFLEQFSSEYGLVYMADGVTQIDTFDLFEALSVVFELCIAAASRDKPYIEKRIGEISSTRYFRAIEFALKWIGVRPTIENIVDFSPTLIIALEQSLNIVSPRSFQFPECPYTWGSFYPPLRLFKIMQILRKNGTVKLSELSSQAVKELEELINVELNAATSVRLRFIENIKTNNLARWNVEGTIPAETWKPVRWYDFQVWLRDCFGFELAKRGLTSLASLFASGQMTSFALAVPPISAGDDGKLRSSKSAFLKPGLQALMIETSSNYYVLDDLIYNSTPLILNPFANSIMQSNEWYKVLAKKLQSEFASRFGVKASFVGI